MATTGPLADHRGRLPHHHALTRLLGEHNSFRSVTQLHEELHARGHWIGLATMYRLLETMSRHGEVHRIAGKRGEARYRLCSSNSEHHHPLVCTTCDAVIEVDSTELDEWAEDTAARHGFTDIQVRATITGTCSTCRTNQGQ